MTISNETLADQYARQGEQWADLESAASLLEETKSAVLSQLMLRQGDMPVSRAEMLSKASSEWNDHVTKMVKARTAANKSKIRLEYLRMKAMEEHSRAATERVQARI